MFLSLLQAKVSKGGVLSATRHPREESRDQHQHDIYSPSTVNYQSNLLAPSLRILTHLVRKGRIPPSTMALTVVEPGITPAERHEKATPPPPVVTTPADPWPRPYFFNDGLRRVYPYHFTYNTYCKERWRDREILDVFTSEFRDRPAAYYVRPSITLNIYSSAHRPSDLILVCRNMPSRQAP